MKKLIILFSFIFVISALPFVASADTSCATKYPIVLSHGMGYTAGGALGIGYWYNIPSTLTGHGAKVFISDQTAMAATSDRAAQLKTYVFKSSPLREHRRSTSSAIHREDSTRDI